MKKRKRNKLILFIIIFGLFLFFMRNNLSFDLSKFVSNSEYKTIKQDTNKNYSGIGQEKVNNKDGYFTAFTTIDNHKKTYIEYKQNGNSSWSTKEYWGGTMSENGCGITALSIILSGYNKNFSPEDLRKKYYPVLKYESLSQELTNTYNIKNTDFYYDTVHLSEKTIKEHLESNRPVLICVWNKKHANRWTASSHYMVLLATDNKNMVYISNPNGGKNDSKSSGWYNFKEVIPYIAKALYIEDYN